MDLMNIVYSGLSLGGLGLIFGVGLGYASQKFAVDEDPRIALIRDVLPGANCGGCGLPGCDAFAAGVVEGTVPPDGCPVAGSGCAQKIGEIMGVEVEEREKTVAFVK